MQQPERRHSVANGFAQVALLAGVELMTPYRSTSFHDADFYLHNYEDTPAPARAPCLSTLRVCILRYQPPRHRLIELCGWCHAVSQTFALHAAGGRPPGRIAIQHGDRFLMETKVGKVR